MINLINRNCPICIKKTETTIAVMPDINPEKEIEIIKKDWSTPENKINIFFPYSRCECGLLYNKIYPDDKSLSTLYSNQKDNVISGEIVLDIKTKNKYLQQIDRVIYDKSKQLKILEVGADNGSFLKLIKEKNLDSRLYSIEPNHNMHEQLKDITEKNFNNIEEIDNSLKFDLIIAIHVFDHIPNLNQYVQKLKSLLNTNGKIFGVVHNERSLMTKILKTRWPAYRLQHPHLFNHDTMNLFFNSIDFDKIFIKKTTNYFNLDFLLKHLIMALFKVKIKLPKLFAISLKLGNFSFLYKKNNH